MQKLLKSNRVTRNPLARRAFPMWLILILATTWFAGQARSQEPPVSGRIYVVTHVDSVPTAVDASTKLLRQYGVDTRKEPGAERVDILIQISRPNHFTIVEVWKDMKAYEAHLGAERTKKFREEIQPFIGSPFDERAHKMLE